MIRLVCLDWGGTLMSEEGGPADLPMGLWPEVRAIDGAAEMLAALAPRYSIAVATNAAVSDRSLIHRALERVSFACYVSEIYCFTEIGARKDTRAFWDVVERTSGVPLQEMAMLGDSLEQDVLGPARFGIRTVWFNPAGGAAPDGVLTVGRLVDFPPLLQTL